MVPIEKKNLNNDKCFDLKEQKRSILAEFNSNYCL